MRREQRGALENAVVVGALCEELVGRAVFDERGRGRGGGGGREKGEGGREGGGRGGGEGERGRGGEGGGGREGEEREEGKKKKKRRGKETSAPAMTATKACVPLVKMSASVSGTSVSEKECVPRRNSSWTGQRSVTNTMMPSAHHQPTSGPRIGSRWRIQARYSTTAAVPVRAFSHHTGSMEFSLRRAARRPSPPRSDHGRSEIRVMWLSPS